jgi:hypothetical protein
MAKPLKYKTKLFAGAIEHANETTRHADVMTNVERSYLDPQDDEEE